MKYPIVVLLSVLVFQVVARNTSPEERKSNMVVQILNKILSADNVTIPKVNLGESGSFENVTVKLQKMTREMDGVGKFGFKLLMNLGEIIATGYYDIRDVDVPGLFPVSGKGNFFASLENVNLTMTLQATANFETERFDIKLQAFGLHVMSSKLDFENLMFDPHVSDFLNELVGNLLPSLVEALGPLLPELMLPALDHYGNGIINCIKSQLNNLENCIKELFVPALHGAERRML